MDMSTKKQIPKGYKLSILGIIPEDWEVKRLGEVCTFLRTNTLSRDQLNDTNGEVRNIHYGDVLIKYPSIIDVRKQSIPFVNQEDYKESMNVFIEDGDIVLADTAEDETVGKACEIANVGSEKILSGLHTMLIRPQKGLFFPWFLGYQVNSVSYRKQLNALVQGIKVCSLGKQAIANTYFAIPPLHEQQSIVSVLSLWDTAIEKQTALIEQLTLRKRGLMQQLLTGKKRLKGFEGGWKRIKAGEIFKSISVKGNGSEVLLSATQEHGVIPRDQLEGRVTMPTGDTNSFKLVEVGDFVISLRSFQGGLEYSEHRGIVSPAYTVLKPIVEIDKSFYRYYFKSAEFIGHLAIAVIGIRDGKQISYEDFCFVKIPYPNIEEQKAISTVLLQADIEIEIQKQKLTALQEQKKGLMQVLLTGKRRVK
jgi:type I restriction enzyme S subunit